MRRTGPLLAIVIAGVLLSCGSDAPEYPVSGRYAQLTALSAIVEVPVLGEVENLIVALSDVNAEQVDDDLVLTSEFCSVEVYSDTDAVTTRFPRAFIDSLPVTQRSARLYLDRHPVQFAAPRSFVLRGVELDDPAGDPLPTDPADPRIFDQDGDGNPGLTVQISGLIEGEIYVIQRASDVYEGEVDDDGRIEGLVVWDDEQVILGADNPVLTQPLSSYPNPDPASHTFSFAPIDRAWTCADIIERQRSLFPGLTSSEP